MTNQVEADYLVVGAGAAGMAFTDALIDNSDASVAIVDRRHGPGGHWLDAYPFVRLHQASSFYGVPSTLLGTGAIQTDGPETGLHERAGAAQICAYYEGVLSERFAGRAQFFGSCEHLGGGRFRSRLSGRDYEARPGCRIVDARYLSPHIPAITDAPFEVADGARAVPVNDLVRLGEETGEFVIAGSGKTATDACIWLLQSGVDPDSICWVRPRDPWMLNRAVIQPDPRVFLSMATDVLGAATDATTPDDFFLGMEAAGVMLRIDPDFQPTMARAPTLAEWELDLLRTIERVVRMGHIRRVEPGRLELDQGSAPIERNAVVVHCAAEGLRCEPPLPIWSDEAITLQPVRAGFPCFGAGLIGYVEATRDDDAEKNRICLPSPYSNTTADWARMNVLGNRASIAFGSVPDVNDWAGRTTLNPAHIPEELAADPDLAAVMQRFGARVEEGVAALDRLSGLSDPDAALGAPSGSGG